MYVVQSFTGYELASAGPASRGHVNSRRRGLSHENPADRNVAFPRLGNSWKHQMPSGCSANQVAMSWRVWSPSSHSNSSKRRTLKVVTSKLFSDNATSGLDKPTENTWENDGQVSSNTTRGPSDFNHRNEVNRHTVPTANNGYANPYT